MTTFPQAAASVQGHAWPRWVQEVVRSLPVRPQVVLTGNVHDLFVAPTVDGSALLPVYECLYRGLAARGFDGLVLYDRTDGLRLYPADGERWHRAARVLDLKLANGATPLLRQNLIDVARRVVASPDPRLALVIDFASRLVQRSTELTPDEHEFFAAFEKLAYASHALVAAGGGPALFNPVIWMADAEGDLPHWFVAGNERVRSFVIPKPDYQTRSVAAAKLVLKLPGAAEGDQAARTASAAAFADQTEGLTLTAMIAITQLALGEGLPAGEIAEAVLRFKVGVAENPWKKDHIRERVRHAEQFIARRVKGQKAAITKTADILKRSIAGLTAAHTSRRSGRPRGVLFFAGPTGVGKTELAKALTECLFSDERAYVRFDMSEFAAEHSDARLLGAPPGYVGFDAGGELTNAIRSRPFSVVLFDEIEKAHPRILDKFLQLLEDGRLTDGSGQTVYFSESVLIFTSNLGVYVQSRSGELVPTIEPGTPYDEIERRLKGAIEHHFKAVLGRPELLNRIGDNIVVFNFIEPPVAAQIFEMMLTNVLHRVHSEHGVELQVEEAIRRELERECTGELQNGGRGIGNALETKFVNPLARELFARECVPGTVLTVVRLGQTDGVYEVGLA